MWAAHMSLHGRSTAYQIATSTPSGQGRWAAAPDSVYMGCAAKSAGMPKLLSCALCTSSLACVLVVSWGLCEGWTVGQKKDAGEGGTKVRDHKQFGSKGKQAPHPVQ